jgi:hypothetical protein
MYKPNERFSIKYMRVFDIYQHPKYGKQAVRRGFSWLAFLAPSVWAVRRGLGLVTVMLVVTTTLMFDIAQLAGSWVSGPVAQLVLLIVLVIAFGLKPGFNGYRWHARVLEEEKFSFKCTVAAKSRRKAIKSANDDNYNNDINVAG